MIQNSNNAETKRGELPNIFDQKSQKNVIRFFKEHIKICGHLREKLKLPPFIVFHIDSKQIITKNLNKQ